MNSEYQTPHPIQTLLNGHMCGSRGGYLENQKFYGFLELAFGPPAPAPPGIGWTPPPPPETL